MLSSIRARIAENRQGRGSDATTRIVLSLHIPKKLAGSCFMPFKRAPCKRLADRSQHRRPVAVCQKLRDVLRIFPTFRLTFSLGPRSLTTQSKILERTKRVVA